MVTLTIDGRTVSVPEGTTILEAAQTLRISIPTLCYLKDINEIGACRICMVEVEGQPRLVPACDNVVDEGMAVHTNSPRVREARRVNLRLLLSQHDTKCTKCTRSGNCKLQQLTNDYNLLGEHYIDDLRNAPPDFSNPVVRIENRCVKCMRCIQICDKVQTMGIWDLMGTGSHTTVGVARTRTLGESDCTFCGQCITHCPVGALRERDDTRQVFEALADPNKITVVQVAPAVRTAWGEFMGLSPEQATVKRMVAALRRIGFDYIFDTNFAADLTIMEEGSEFLQRLKNPGAFKAPMFTSCCPGWVRFLKSQYPDMVSQLSTAKSPQQMFGAVAKSYYAQLLGVDPQRIYSVSIMPCLAKKQEAALPTMESAGAGPDVDVVLTTRELSRMIRAEHIIPAADISEQISPAGTEASGTGNMKLMLNGAVTLGTMDGANVEIVERAGLENNYIFGASVEEINDIRESYCARDVYNSNPRIRRAVDTLVNGTVPTDSELRELYTSLLDGASWHRPDHYFLLKDLPSYQQARLQANRDYRDRVEFGRKCLMNVASAGYFSSDRTIRQYAKEIWKL